VDILPTGWNGEERLDTSDVFQGESNPVIFFQSPPPENILHNPGARLVWIPMWDQAQAYDQSWWNGLPKNLRVVAFSKVILEKACEAGLSTLFLRFYDNPLDYEPARWNGDRILLYWNRTGLLGPEFLRRFCAELEIDCLFFVDRIDPLIPASADYRLPARLGKTEVHFIKQPDFLPRQEYLRFVNKTNIFIAPRPREGIGLTLLEAMGRGCAVFGYNAPTMNEYIQHRENGYLMPAYQPSGINRLRVASGHFAWRLPPLRLFRRRHFERLLTHLQDWDEIRQLDLRKLGEAAIRTHRAGYKEWLDKIPEYARFIMDW
jgi:hypothetical protein